MMKSISDLLLNPHFIYLFIYSRQTPALSLRLECSGVITAHCSLEFLGLSNSLTSGSQVTGSTGACLPSMLIFVFFVETGSRHLAQAGRFLGSTYFYQEAHCI